MAKAPTRTQRGPYTEDEEQKAPLFEPVVAGEAALCVQAARVSDTVPISMKARDVLND